MVACKESKHRRPCDDLAVDPSRYIAELRGFDGDIGPWLGADLRKELVLLHGGQCGHIDLIGRMAYKRIANPHFSKMVERILQRLRLSTPPHWTVGQP